MSKGPSKRKPLLDTPYASRPSMIGLEKLPQLNNNMEKVMNANVYQHHHDLSDDEEMTDKAFKDTSKDHSNELIDSLKNNQMEGIYESIIDYEYQVLRKNSFVKKGTLNTII